MDWRGLAARILTIVGISGLFGSVLAGQAGSSIELISVTPGGIAGGVQGVSSLVPPFQGGPHILSADNRYVVFSSPSDQLVAGDVNGVQDVFLRDRQTGTTTIVSLAADGSQANGDSGTPVISADGRYVAFVSVATNLVPGDANGYFDVFVRDLQTGTNALVSVSTSGAQANFGGSDPTISADGRYIAFASYSQNLVPPEANLYNTDVFVRDMLLGTTERVSVRPDGSQIIGSESMRPSISADGSRIAFMVLDNTLGGPTPQVPPNLHKGVYVRDLNTSQTILVSVRPDGSPSERLLSLDPVISANGRYVSFTNWEDLDPNYPDSAEEDDGPFRDVFVRDLQGGITERISLPFPGGPAEESGGRATISADGRYVAYLPRSADVVRLRDRVTGTTTVITAPGGVPADGFQESPSISEDGQFVYFESYATNLVPNDTNGQLDAFLFRAAPSADLSLTLVATNTQPPTGTDVTFTVNVTNSGPHDTTGVEVRALLPAGLAYVSDTGGGSYVTGTGVWTVGALAAGSGGTLQIVGHFTATSPTTVSAEVSASALFDPDSTPDNNNPAEDDFRAVVLTPQIADLSLALTANTTDPLVNSNVTLTITLTNSGPGAATGVTVGAPLPAGLTFVSASPAAVYNGASGVWTPGILPVGVSIPNGASLSLQLVARVTSGAAVDVIAQVSASDQSDPDSVPNNNNAAEDDHAVAHLTPIATAGIIVNDASPAVNPNDGKCTLIEAIVAANTDLPSGNAIGECVGGNGPDTIRLSALNAPKDFFGIRDQYRLIAVHNSIDGPNGLPPITSVITIEGGGADIARFAGPPFRLFYVTPSGQLTLNSVAVTGGRLASATPNTWEPFGGGVLNLGVLEVNYSYFAGNVALCDGGAILSNGPLTVRFSSLQFNETGCSGGAISTFYAGQVLLAGLNVQFNSAAAGSGGGLMIHGTTAATITDSWIDSNVARFDGGGLLAHGADADVSFAGSSITNNLVQAGHGGGVANGRLWPGPSGAILVPGGSMSMINTTIANNTSTGGYGGGVVNAGTLTIATSTLSANHLSGVAAFSCGGGLYSVGPLTITSTNVVWNTAGSQSGGGLCAIFSQMTMTGGSVTGNSAGGAGGGVLIWAMPNVVLSGVAVAGNTAFYGGGLYRFSALGTDSLILDNTVVEQNTALGDGGGIVIQGDITTLRNNTRVSTNTAAGAGGGILVVYAGACCRAKVTMNGGSIEGNTANGVWSGAGGGGGLANLLDMDPSGSVTLTDVVVRNNRAPGGGNGGGIFNRGNLSMIRGELRDNLGQSGGALSNGTSLMTGGTVTLTDVAIENNVATSLGGAIFNANPPGAAVANSVTVAGGSIRNNRALNGGAIFLRPNSTLNIGSGAIISGNIATSTGGAIDSSGTIAITGATLSGNSADTGGAIYAAGPSTITASTINGNTARIAAGLRVTAGVIDIVNSTLSGNTATVDGGGALEVSGVVLPGGGISGRVNLTATTIVANTGNPGGIRIGGYVRLFSTILAGNGRPDGSVSECAWAPAPAWAEYDANLVGQDAACPFAVSNSSALNRTVDATTLFTSVLGPLANNGGPTKTHALLPGSLAIDGGHLAGPFCLASDQRGEPRPADGDGDGIARCDTGALEQQIPLASPQAVAASLNPRSALAGSGTQLVVVNGAAFVAGSVAYLNGMPRATFVKSPIELSVIVLASDLNTTADITSAVLTVLNPGTAPSNSLAFTIVSSRVAQVNTQIAQPASAATASALPVLAGQAGVSVTLTNNDPASSPAIVSVATYAVSPVGGTVFAAGGFFDVQVTGADPSDSVDARFYYPTSVTGAVEAGLQLRYWTGTSWAPVIGSGGAVPSKDTADNLDGTVSGGRFAVTFDNTSTPGIMDLKGTVFAIVESNDVAPPVTNASQSPAANANGWNNTDVTVTLTATDALSPIDFTEFNVNGKGWQTYKGPIQLMKEGVYNLRFRSRDAAGNTEEPKTLNVKIDKTPPLFFAVAIPGVLWPPNGKLVDVVVRAAALDWFSGADGFTLTSVTSDDPSTGADDLQGWAIGTNDTRGKLRAERSNHGGARVYRLRYRAVDRAGNGASTTAIVLVPRGSGEKPDDR